MKLARNIWSKIRSLWRRTAVKREIDEELRFHLEQATAEYRAAGMSPEDAAREARKGFGNLQSIREDCREARGASLEETTFQDVRFGLRMVRKNPGFTAVAGLTLALGIGANTVIFSLIDGVLLHPLPYREPDRLVTVCESNLKRGIPQMIASIGNILDWRAQNHVFEDIAAEVYESFNLTGIEKPEHLQAAEVTANYFSVLGVQPFLGRTFLAGEDRPGHEVTILSHELWRNRFASDSHVLGRTIALNGQRYTIVGIMPATFECFNPRTVFGRPTGSVRPQLWVPYVSSPYERKARNAKYFLALARLKPGVTVTQAQRDMDGIAARLARLYPAQKGWGVNVQSFREQIVGPMRPALLTLLGAVAFLLLIACANVANLLLARSAVRHQEFAIRSALGAGRARLFRQLLTESLMLALLGGALGVLLAHWGLSGVRALGPAHIPRLAEVRLNAPMLGLALLISLITAVAFGLVPALRASRSGPDEALKQSSRNSSGSLRRNRARCVLLVSEVALAMILLVGAALMIASLARLSGVNPGFDPDQLLTCDISLPYPEYADAAKRITVVKELQNRIQSVPGVKSAATVFGLPFDTMLNATTYLRTGDGSSYDSQAGLNVGFRQVSPDYFGTMGIPVLKGRGFSAEDTAQTRPVAILNETLARKLYPHADPIGKRIHGIWISDTNWCEIVGVIRDVKLTGLDAPAEPEIYRPQLQDCAWMLSLVVRSSLEHGPLAKMVQDQVAAVVKDLPIYRVRTMDQAISDTVAPRRFTMILIAFFAALALVLTAVGLYGVVSYSVSQNTREIGIRMALGASRYAVLGLMLREGLVVALLGLGIGAVGSLALTGLIANQLFGVSATDPATFLIVGTLLMLVTLAACYFPARRVTKVDPMIALRTE